MAEINAVHNEQYVLRIAFEMFIQMELHYGPYSWREDLMVEFLYKASGKVINSCDILWIF